MANIRKLKSVNMASPNLIVHEEVTVESERKYNS